MMKEKNTEMIVKSAMENAIEKAISNSYDRLVDAFMDAYGHLKSSVYNGMQVAKDAFGEDSEQYSELDSAFGKLVKMDCEPWIGAVKSCVERFLI